MKKFVKSLLAVLLSATMIASVCALTACSGSGDTSSSSSSSSSGSSSSSQPEEETYVFKFTVLDPDGNPVEGAQVQLCENEMCYIPVTTDENGVAIFQESQIDGFSVEKEYDIHLVCNYGSETVAIKGQNSDYTFDNSAMKAKAANEDEYVLNLVLQA